MTDIVRPVVGPALSETRVSRVVAVACTLGACMVAVAALQVGSGATRGGASELVVLEGRDAVLNGFAELSAQKRKAELKQMLTSAEQFSRQIDGASRTQLAPSSKLCEKKDLIIGKFDQVGDNESVKLSMQKW